MTGLEFQAIAYVMAYGGVQSYAVAQAIVWGATLLATGYAAKRIGDAKAREIEADMRRKARNRAVEVQNMQSGTVAPRRFIYGEMIVNGHLVFQETAGASKKDLYRVVYLGEGPIQSATEVYFNDEQISLVGDLDNTGALIITTAYNGYASARVGLNGNAGSSSSYLSSIDLVGQTSWTNNHKMTGNAWLAYKLIHNNEVWTQGVPQVRVKVQGRKVYDPRLDGGGVGGGSGSHRYDNEATWAFSENSALCILDFLINGMDVDPSDIDMAAMRTAADICDEDVNIYASSGSSTTQKRYTTNGVAFLDDEVIATLEQLLAPCHGLLIEEGGVLRLVVPKDGTNVPVVGLTEDDMISEVNININAEVQSRINKVAGTFNDKESSYQTVDFSPISSSSLITSDGREHLQQIDLAFVTDEARAQRIASIVLKENSLTNTIELVLKPKFSYLKVADVVTVTFEPEKLANVGTDSIVTTATKWRISSYNLTPEGAVKVMLEEYSDSSYSWNPADHEYLTRSALADSFIDTITAPTLGTPLKRNFLDENGNQVLSINIPVTHGGHPNFAYTSVALSRIGVTSNNAEVGLDMVDHIRATQSDTNIKFTGLSTQIEAQHVNTYVSYKFKIFARTYVENGKRSAPTELDVTQYIGVDTTAPSVPTTSSGLDADGGFRQVKLTWVNPTDLDFKKAKVYRNTTNSPSAADLIGETVSNTFTDTNLPDNATRYYWVTAVDNVGNESSKFSLGSPTTDTAFPKGEKGDTVKGQKGDAVKGDKGDTVKGQKGDTVKGQKGQGGDKGQKGQGDKGSQGDPAYPAFGKFAYYRSTSDTTPNLDGRIFFGASSTQQSTQASDGDWPDTLFIRLDEDGRSDASDVVGSQIYLQTELDNAVKVNGTGLLIWEDDDNWGYYRPTDFGGGASSGGGYHYMEGTKVSSMGQIDVTSQWYKVSVDSEPLSALLITLNGADIYMNNENNQGDTVGSDPRPNNSTTQGKLDNAYLQSNPLLTRMTQIPEYSIVWARFVFKKTQTFTTSSGQTTFTLTGGHTPDKHTTVRYDIGGLNEQLFSGDFKATDTDSSGSSPSIILQPQFLNRIGVSSIPANKTVEIDYIQASTRSWDYGTQNWTNSAENFDSPAIFSPSVFSKEILTQALAANEITADQLIVNKDVDLLDGAAWRIGKSDYSSVADGIFFGNPAGSGATNYAFAFTATSNSGNSNEHGIEITPQHTKLIQPIITKQASGASSISDTQQTTTITIKSSSVNPNAQTVTINAIGGGGGGAGADSQSGSAGSGGDTVYTLTLTKAGQSNTVYSNVTASGGSAGTGYGAAKTDGDRGQDSARATGGYGGGANSVGGAGSLGSGGGGGGGRDASAWTTSRKGGAGGGAGQHISNTYDISTFDTASLSITSMGSGGAGMGSSRGYGGAGGTGVVYGTIQTSGLDPVVLNTDAEYKSGTVGRFQSWQSITLSQNVWVANPDDQPVQVCLSQGVAGGGTSNFQIADDSNGTNAFTISQKSDDNVRELMAAAIIPVGKYFRQTNHGGYLATILRT